MPALGTLMSRILNLVISRWNWSFCATQFRPHRRVLYEGESLILSASIRNDGYRLGTVYAQFLTADSYRLDLPVFDSHRDLSPNERHAVRVVDILRGEFRSIACAYKIPAGSSFRHFDIRLQIWNPHRLFDGPRPWKYFDTGWVGGFEVISAPNAHIPLTVFISYSWDPLEHKAWVRRLVEELRKHDIATVVDLNDLRPGEEATLFMEKGISTSKVTLLICSESYTRKANERNAGGVGFETILSSHEYAIRSPEERSRFIAVVRDNDLPRGRKLPRYLGSMIYVDMSGPDWQAGPMLALVDAIRRRA